MYRCLECGKVFDVPYECTESYGQTFSGSPCCHTNYDEAPLCECGNIKEEYHKYCDKCEGVIEIENERIRDTA